MLSWWTNIESVAMLNHWMLTATLVFAVLTGIMVFLTAGKSKTLIGRLCENLESSRKRIKSLEKAAEAIRKELLATQQYQDINQLKLKTSKSSTEELRQALFVARKRLETAETAIKSHQVQAEYNAAETEAIEPSDLDLELELEPEGGLSENQRDQLIDLLDPGPKGNLDIFCVMGDASSEMTAKQLEAILTADGWKTNGVAQSAFSNPPKGIMLAVNSKETAPSYASFLQRVFSTIGIEVSAKVDSKYREWSLTVIVGTIDG
jgi:galactitol-specific phosphotransferase system IIB component